MGCSRFSKKGRCASIFVIWCISGGLCKLRSSKCFVFVGKASINWEPLFSLYKPQVFHQGIFNLLQVNSYESKLNSAGEVSIPVASLAQAPVIKKDMVIVKRFQKTVHVEVKSVIFGSFFNTNLIFFKLWHFPGASFIYLALNTSLKCIIFMLYNRGKMEILWVKNFAGTGIWTHNCPTSSS